MCRAGSITPFASLLALGLPALAQSPDDLERELMELLNTKVTVASKAAESLNAAPGIISVVSRMEIEGFAAQNLGVSDVKVAKSSGSRRLDRAAQQAARNGRFQPSGWTEYTIPVAFKIN